VGDPVVEDRQMAALSVELVPDPPAGETPAAIEAADAAGLHTAFLVDEIYHRDAWLLAARTRRNRLAGRGGSRHPP
jgi:hypothetical protein